MSSTSTPSKKNGKGKPTPRKKRSSTYSDNAVGFYEDETQELVGSQDGDFIAVADGDSGSPRRIDEMECVENLLSLRGGTWR